MSEHPSHVLQIVRELNPHGGVGGVVNELQRAFEAKGMTNSVLTLADVLGAQRKQDQYSKLRLLMDVVAFTFAGSVAIQRLRRQHPDWLIINHSDPLGGDIFVDHGLHKAMVQQRPWMVLKNPLHLFLLAREEVRHRLGLYRAVVCLSHNGVEAMRKAFPSARKAQVVAIPNGISLERYRPDPERLSERAPGAALDLVFVGHEFDRKGLRFVIEALAALPPDIRLTVVGGSAAMIEKEQARAAGLKVGDRVSFLGKRTDVPDILRASDLLLLPSAAEAWPLVALEAMASGVPVLMTDVAAGREIVGDNLGGRLILRSTEDIVRQIRSLFEDPAAFLALRRGAVQKAQMFPWSAIAERYLDLGRQIRGG